MSFKDMVENDILGVFLNAEELADQRTVIYDGETYTKIPIILKAFKEEDRHQTVQDHGEGIYLVTQVMHCAISSLGGVIPENGMTIQIEDENGYYDKFTIAQAGTEMGMLRIELEAYAE